LSPIGLQGIYSTIQANGGRPYKTPSFPPDRCGSKLFFLPRNLCINIKQLSEFYLRDLYESTFESTIMKEMKRIRMTVPSYLNEISTNQLGNKVVVTVRRVGRCYTPTVPTSLYSMLRDIYLKTT
jgi:hypothetical protein